MWARAHSPLLHVTSEVDGVDAACAYVRVSTEVQDCDPEPRKVLSVHHSSGRSQSTWAVVPDLRQRPL